MESCYIDLQADLKIWKDRGLNLRIIKSQARPLKKKLISNYMKKKKPTIFLQTMNHLKLCVPHQTKTKNAENINNLQKCFQMTRTPHLTKIGTTQPSQDNRHLIVGLLGALILWEILQTVSHNIGYSLS